MPTRFAARWLVSGLLMVGVSAGFLLLIGEEPATQAQQRTSSPATPAQQHASALSDAFREASEKAMPAVVTIRQTSVPRRVARERGRGRQDLPEELLNDPFFRRFFEGMPELREAPDMPRGGQSAGSGVILSAEGLVLTNNHVVSGGGKIVVRLSDGREFEATEVKTDPATDLAIVRIQADGPLPAARLGDSDSVRVGDWVLALGQPFGLANTVTAGIISAKGRGIGITEHEEFLQTDAAINPGNSGGPLVNLAGEVVGINTAISSTTGGYQGIGFAVPVNVAKWVVEQLQSEGKVHRAYLGIGIQPVTQELATQLGMPRPRGALVTEVRADSPAQKAGLQVGDVVLAYAGTELNDPRELSAIVARTKIGSRQELRVLRGGKEQTLTVNVLEMPTGFKSPERSGGTTEAPEGTSVESLGLEVAPLTADKANELGLKNVQGLLIVGVADDTPAARAGLEPGMVIERVGQKPVDSVAALQQAMQQASLERGVLLLVRTSNGSRFVVVKN